MIHYLIPAAHHFTVVGRNVFKQTFICKQEKKLLHLHQYKEPKIVIYILINYLSTIFVI